MNPPERNPASQFDRRSLLLRGAALGLGSAIVAASASDEAFSDAKELKVNRAKSGYDPEITALLCIDFYNDFLSEGGKMWPWVEQIAREVNLLDNLREIVRVAREAGIKVYHVPHHRWEPGDYVNWKYPSPYQLGAVERRPFAKGTWGGMFHDGFQVEEGDVLVTEHWASSGFPNTDLEHQLKRYGKEKIICVGLMANTCIEATARIGMELGFHVTLVRDGTAARSKEAMSAAHDINGPTYAHEILTTAELVESIQKSSSRGAQKKG